MNLVVDPPGTFTVSAARATESVATKEDRLVVVLIELAGAPGDVCLHAVAIMR